MNDQDLLNDDDRLLRANEARLMLGNMPESTFYRYIKNGLIPRQRYIGCTPVWRLGDIRRVVEQLPNKPMLPTPATGQDNRPIPA